VAEPVNFEQGEGRLQATGRVDALHAKRYIVNLKEGQTITAALLRGSATLHIRNGESKSIQRGLSTWQSAPQAQSSAYHVDVEAPLDTDYILELSMESLKSNAERFPNAQGEPLATNKP
jgi:hypothetical protein